MGGVNITRRAALGALGAVVIGSLAGCTDSGGLESGDDIDPFLDQSVDEGDRSIYIPPGTYEWHGDGLDARGVLAGEGHSGDVVLELRSGSMHGSVRGILENIVVRGLNPESKAGLDLYPGGEINGFCWPEGGDKSEDRAIYHPEGGARTAIRNSCVAGMVNNGAYVDKAPVTVENCAFLNNNVANLRVGLRDGSNRSATSHIRNSLVAVTSETRTGDEADDQNPVGLRIRHPGRFVIENCWLVFADGAPHADGIVELRGDEITAEFRNCHFHNDTESELVLDNGSDNQATISNCTVSGSGRTTVSAESVSGSLAQTAVRVPLPSTVTGFRQADEAYGFDPGTAPFSRGGGANSVLGDG